MFVGVGQCLQKEELSRDEQPQIDNIPNKLVV